MVETLTGTNRSKGLSYQELLKTDSKSVPASLKKQSSADDAPLSIGVERYYTREFHDLEVEKLWGRVWQLACHEDDIPNVGDVLNYDIASLSYIVVRTSENEFSAFPNACRHRGRKLVDCRKKGLGVLRCPFHGWSWSLDGKLKEVPCQWDFPGVSEATHSLPKVKTGRWGGFVFINPDPDAQPLEEFLGDINEHWSTLPFERRYKAVHVAKKLPCNWKIAQEAFMESYHVIATHPTLLLEMGDANSQYDSFGTLSRAISPQGIASPHIDTELAGEPFDDTTPFTAYRHPITGDFYERLEEDRIRLTKKDGRNGIFDSNAEPLEGELENADQHICNWFGGRLTPDMEADKHVFGALPVAEARAQRAAARREQLRPLMGDEIDKVCDAELVDSIYYSIFPNISPWGCYNPIFYRFRPDGDNTEKCIHEVMFMMPVPEGQDRPPAAQIRWLDMDDDYMEAPELGRLAKVFNQDQLNLRAVQQGLHSVPEGRVTLAEYQETKIRHFHANLNDWLGL
ncbi:MAG: nitrite reductase/ring-hydroxylating ferredoxin subunit [Parasphingorhabdus sp.]|jgi:nitrite reductase/ring-hydroxylating ferredoxin subunit